MSLKVKNIMYVSFLFIIDVLIVASIYMKIYFSDNSIDELLFCLKFESSDSDFTPLFAALKVMFPYIIVLFIIFLVIFYNSSFFGFKKSDRLLKITYNRKASSIFLLIVALIVFVFSFDVVKYIYYKNISSDFISNNYVSPNKENITFNEKRNLIYIVLESFESTLLDLDNGGSFGYSIIPEMDKLVNEDDVITFKSDNGKIGSRVIDGASFTSASLIASSTGLPFKYSVFHTYDENNFLSGIYNLGDLLYDNGYHNELISAATTNFGGLNYYYKNHGKYDILDISRYSDYGLSLEEIDKGPWGFNDNYMYESAKKRLEVLSKDDKPFNLTMIGIDTHFPDGFSGEYTLNRFDDSYSNAYATESYLLYNFINWIREQEFYKDTTIVVTGDHLSMQNSFFKDIKKGDRYAFVCYINAVNNPINKENRIYTALDTYPTILGAMGVDIKDNRLGLGVNMFSEEKTLAEKYGYSYVDKELQKKSKFYFETIK